MPKSQPTLASFFGAGAKKKPKTPTKLKENSENSDENASKLPQKRENEDDVVTSKKAKRRVVMDSDDEDEHKMDSSDNKSNKMGEEKPGDGDPKAPTPKETKAATEPAKKGSKETSKGSPAPKSGIPSDTSSERNVPADSDLLKACKGIKSNQKIVDEVKDSWQPGSRMPYSLLCQAFERIESITSRLQIQEIMTTLLRQIVICNPQDLQVILYLASNEVAPAYECVELGIGDSILIRAIGEATGTNPDMVKQSYQEIGDLGNVAKSFKSKQRTLGGFFSKGNAVKKFLTVTEILKVFRQIAVTKGNQSQKWKVEMIKKLLVNATDAVETKYIIRGLQGKLRIGLAQSTNLISLAHCMALTPPTGVSNFNISDVNSDNFPDEAKQYFASNTPPEKRLEAAVAIMKKAYSEVPSYDTILEGVFKVPLQLLHKECTLTPGIPVAPMLAKPTKSIQEVLKRLSGMNFTCEYKYDGERAQVHLLSDGSTRVFSRNLLDTSEKYPEVPIFVKEACKDVTSFVLDAEVVAFNNKTGQLVPFQVLSTRKKTEESADTAKVQVIVQAFDLMYLNGESLLEKTLATRRDLMKKHFKPVEGKFQFAVSLDHEENGDTTIIEEFLDNAVKGQCEGLMVKTLDVNAIYEPSRRSLNWLKLKKDYLEGLGDSVDLVPLGAFYGRGKRTGVYGAYLLACYDPDTEEFQSVCKIGTGFSEEDLKSLSEIMNKSRIQSKSQQYNVSETLECDVWFDATEVWEVKAADLSKSSTHKGADGKTGEEGRGIGLRFPRFERRREDKKPEQATTSDQILEMYYQQDTIVGGGDGMDDDGI